MYQSERKNHPVKINDINQTFLKFIEVAVLLLTRHLR